MKRVVLAAFILVGCGDSDDPGGLDPDRVCEERSGAYQFDLVAESGTCPSPISSIVTVGVPGAMPAGAGCTGGTTTSVNNCSVVVDAVCPGAQTGDIIKMAGKVDWNADGTLGTGKLSMLITLASGASCNGLYRATYKKL